MKCLPYAASVIGIHLLLVGCGLKDYLTKEETETTEASQQEQATSEVNSTVNTSANSTEQTPNKKGGTTAKNQSEGSASCQANDIEATLPTTIEEAIALINSLPKPVSIECFISALPRPLMINGTRSQLSAQPAYGSGNPRIFIFSSNLIMSIVPAGFGSDTLEFSFLLSSSESIKGELAFPVEQNLAPNAAYASILGDKKERTHCSSCHTNEEKAPAGFDELAFVSKAFRPTKVHEVSKSDFNVILENCRQETTERCMLIKALLEGDFEIKSFPGAMPTIF